MKSKKTRILVFGIFFLALIVFAIVYQPTSALSNTTDQSGATAPAVSR